MLAFDQVKVPLMLENDQNGKTSIFDSLTEKEVVNFDVLK
jgi:hypothetical protein